MVGAFPMYKTKYFQKQGTWRNLCAFYIGDREAAINKFRKTEGTVNANQKE